MSDSITKYQELLSQTPLVETVYQRGVRTLCEILSATSKVDLVQELVLKASELSIKNPDLPVVTIFQIAADDLKVDELCNKIQ